MTKAIHFIIVLAGSFFISMHSHAQIITTVAGNGVAAYSGDGGLADTAALNNPQGVAVDAAGNVYIADQGNSRIRKISTTGIITTVAGISIYGGYNGDSIPATTAMLFAPTGVTVDATGNIYIADNGNFRVRKVDTFGIITTIGGIGGIAGFGYSGDSGLAIHAHMYVQNVALDRSCQNLYVADGNEAIRKIDLGTDIITTVAGCNAYGYTGDGGPATSATFANPTGVTLDTAGNIYIADQNDDVLRKVNTAAIPVIKRFAGTPGSAGYSGDGSLAIDAKTDMPYSLYADAAGNVYFADQGNNRVRKIDTAGIITTVAGNGVGGYNGDSILAKSAKLNSPGSVAVDASGNIYIADAGNNRVRKITPAPSTTGITQVTPDQDITVYPNPATGLLNITIPATAGVSVITVTDLFGRTVLSREAGAQCTSVQLATDALPRGTYLLKVQNSASSMVRKVVLE